MAGAAAKKAAAARKSASSFYLPLLVAVNVLYGIVRYLKGTTSNSFWTGAGLLSIFGLQIFAYYGILEDAARPRATNDTALVGGASLDVLMLAVVIQFSAVLWSPQCYWLLLIFPPWGAFSLYKTFRSGSSSSTARTSSGKTSGLVESETPSEVQDRRQKRAERRRQKRY